MSALPDPDEMCAIADRVAGHADAVRHRACVLQDRLADLHWDGVAALAFEVSVTGLLSALHRSATRLDDAADALRRHAAEVRRALDALRHAIDGLGGLGFDVASTLHDVFFDPAGLVGDTRDLARHAHDLVGSARPGGGH